MNIDNLEGFYIVLEKKLELFLKELSEKVFNLLIDLIKENIYEAPKSDWYKRTGEFLNAFTLSKIREIADGFTRDLFFDGTTIQEPTFSINSGYSHGDINTYTDRRTELWWILNDSIFNSEESEFGGAIGVRNSASGYLDQFYNELQAYFTDWCREIGKKYGFELSGPIY